MSSPKIIRNDKSKQRKSSKRIDNPFSSTYEIIDNLNMNEEYPYMCYTTKDNHEITNSDLLIMGMMESVVLIFLSFILIY